MKQCSDQQMVALTRNYLKYAVVSRMYLINVSSELLSFRCWEYEADRNDADDYCTAIMQGEENN